MKWLILFLLLTILLYMLWNHFTFQEDVPGNVHVNKKNVDTSIEQMGKIIKESIVLLDPVVLHQKTEELISNGSVNASVESIILNKHQEYYFNHLSDVVIGKYKFSKVEEILIVNNIIKEVIINIPELSLDDYSPHRNNYLMLMICRRLMVTFEIPIMKKLLVGQWIVNKTYDNNEIIKIYDYILYISTNQDIPLKTRMNAVDILIQSNNNQYLTESKEAVNILRNDEDRIIQAQAQVPPQAVQPQVPRDPFGRINIDEQRILLDIFNREKNNKVAAQLNKKTNKSIYNDSQNVHESSINKFVIDASKKLISDNKSERIHTFEYNQGGELSLSDREKIKDSIHRITTDIATFNNGFTLYEVYQSLLKKIETSPNKDELYKRLREELIDMSGLCATGHLSRLIMVSQGFDSDTGSSTNTNETIKMDIDKEMYAKIKSYLDKAIQASENSEDLIDSLIGDKHLIRNFIQVEGLKILPEILKEYKNIEDDKTIRNIYESCLDKYIKS